MITFEQVLYVIPVLALAASITYYAMVLRNQDKTRRIQYSMQFLQNSMNDDRMQRHLDVINMDYESYADFLRKWDSSVNREDAVKRMTIWWRYNSIGYMLRDGLLDAETVYNFIGPASLGQWKHWGPVIREQIKRSEVASSQFDGFEYLNEEMNNIRTKRENQSNR